MARAACLLLVLGLAAGCEARFKDLSPELSSQMPDAGVLQDAGVIDGSLPDAAVEDAGMQILLATGAWQGRSGYQASGTVSLVDLDGMRRLEFDDDFMASGVPGPFVVVSTRDSLNGGVQGALGDRTLGPLQQPSGAQSYDIPAEVGTIDYVWVYCQPFTVEVARAELVGTP